jgi:hypothetical protein
MRSIFALLAVVAWGCGDDAANPSSGAPTDGGIDAAGGAAGNGNSGGAAGAVGGSAGKAGSAGTSGGAGAGGSGGAACSPSTPWAQSFTAVRERHVSPAGDDAAGDGSSEKPWATVGGALLKAQAGDRVHVAAGTYGCSTWWIDGTTGAAQGTVDHPIWVVGDAGAVVDCGDPVNGDTQALQLSGVKYVVLESLEFRNAGTHILHVDGHSKGVLFRNVHAHRAGMACLKASQSEEVSIEDSEFAEAGLNGDASKSEASGQIIDHVGVHFSYVARSKIHGAMGNGTGSAGNVAIQFKGGSHDIVIAQNRIWDAATGVNLGGSTGAAYFDPQDADYEGKNVVAYANLLTGTMSVAFAAVGCHQCGIYNNTVYAPVDHQAIRALPGALPTGGTSHVAGFDVKNNLFFFAGGKPQDLFNATADDQSGVVQASNLFYAPGTSIASIWSDIPVVGTPGVILDQDPKLVAPPDDMHLGTGSPATGAGVAVPQYAGDFGGTCRTAWNIGAY